MALLTPSERTFATALTRIIYSNPFLPERIQHEREALGDEFVEKDADWNVHIISEGHHLNINRLKERAGLLAEAARDRIQKGARPSAEDLRLYQDAVLFFLYHSYFEKFSALIASGAQPGDWTEPVGEPSKRKQAVPFYREFVQDLDRFLSVRGLESARNEAPAHLFACLFQVRRAFYHIFFFLVGASPPVVRLRAAAWQSIFTHDLRRYRESLYERMGDFTTLIMGPSGTGKELVARAIGLSRYIPFDTKAQAFAEESMGSFHPLSVSELSPTLVESELFGHRRGSFTGALEDRAGWLEVCRPFGTVFLDEVGEIESPIQVKLLRVLQTRTFQRIGETRTREFHGKIIVATNRDLAAEMAAGRFRPDLYYRLCADMITTPSLHEQLVESPGELERLALFVSRRVAGVAGEKLATDVLAWIEKHLGSDYAWPGNFRELEQCVRNVLIRGEYHPPTAGAQAQSVQARLAAEFIEGSLTADELLQRYATLVYGKSGSYEGTARRLGLDRRTVRKKVDRELLVELRRGGV